MKNLWYKRLSLYERFLNVTPSKFYGLGFENKNPKFPIKKIIFRIPKFV